LKLTILKNKSKRLLIIKNEIKAIKAPREKKIRTVCIFSNAIIPNKYLKRERSQYLNTRNIENGRKHKTTVTNSLGRQLKGVNKCRKSV